jgi:energy-coupling factor transporter ATP-binding protein EcfA2
MKKVYCMIAANGSGKTTLIKSLISNHLSGRCKIFEDETWDVIAPPWINGNKTADDKALIVGLYGNRTIGGGDLMGRKVFWKAMRAAAQYRGANRIIVEALKISSPEFYHSLESFCANSGFSLHTTLIYADLITCYKRHVVRGAPKATYPIATVMMRHMRAKYLYEIIDKDKKSIVENMGNPEVAAKKYLNIVFKGTK